MSDVAIVDYGMGNIGSVVNAFNYLGINNYVTDDARKLNHARMIVLPGVGAFHAAMKNLNESGLDQALHEQVLHHKKPFMGICLGMQLIAQNSSELCSTDGLGWINGQVIQVQPSEQLLIPHVGWNEVEVCQTSSLFNHIDNNAHFFFDHSYHLQCEDDLVLAKCNYGEMLVAAVQKENIVAFQFHPEKSQRNGLKLLRNFYNLMRTV